MWYNDSSQKSFARLDKIYLYIDLFQGMTLEGDFVASKEKPKVFS